MSCPITIQGFLVKLKQSTTLKKNASDFEIETMRRVYWAPTHVPFSPFGTNLDTLCLDTSGRSVATSHKGIKIYEDSEWQADTFAGEFLMPFSVIKKEKLMTPEAISRRFNVSYAAATIRLKKLKLI